MKGERRGVDGEEREERETVSNERWKTAVAKGRRNEARHRARSRDREILWISKHPISRRCPTLRKFKSHGNQ